MKKLLKQIAELKGNSAELNEDQRKKVEGEAALLVELKELDI